MNDDVPWLNAEEQQLWRSWLHLTAVLPAVLHRELQADAGLSLPDFDVLVKLTDTPEGRVRYRDLALALNWDRSRVSHHVTRMERRGLVEREDCEDDGRGAFVVVTEQGRAAIEAAAPAHVRTVRRLVLDPLTAEEIGTLSRLVEVLAARVDQE